MPTPNVRLKLGGMLYGGWQEIRIQRSIEQVSGRFDLRVTERWGGQDTVRPILPGMACQVLVEDKPVITGYVDDVVIGYDATNHTVTVSGRDNTGDLVDCSPPLGYSGLSNHTLLEIARRLCEPYKIPVTAEVDVGGRFIHLLSAGGSILEELNKGARMRALLLVADGKGGLLITRASTERIPATLLLGENVLACEASFSHRERFSEYTITGSHNVPADEKEYESALLIKGQATDDLVGRHRPLVISDVYLEGLADARRFAEHERNVHFGRSQTLRYIVQGWHYAPGKIWPINRMVPVRDELVGLDADRLIVGVAFILDDGGARTELTLMPREAFDLIALPEKGDNFAAL